MERSEIEVALTARGWLAGCEPALRRAILDRARPVAFAPDQIVFHAGDLAGGIYGIARGSFALSVGAAATGPALATILRTGVWFGNGPLIAERRRMLTFHAAEASLTLHLPLVAIREISGASIAAARVFADLANRNMQLAIRTVSDLLIPDTERRIAATLLRLTRADEGELPPHSAGFRLRQTELGEMANASRRSVVRALAKLEAQGWVTPGRQRIAIRDAQALARYAYGEGAGNEFPAGEREGLAPRRP
jgi:CRP/FNR family transcriptional regulator, cyclic AMP receptor protein